MWSQSAIPDLEILPQQIEIKAPFPDKKTVVVKFINNTLYPVAFRTRLVPMYPLMGVKHLSIDPSNGVVDPKQTREISITFDPKCPGVLLQPGQFEYLQIETIFAPQWPDADLDEIWRTIGAVRSQPRNYVPGLPVPMLDVINRPPQTVQISYIYPFEEGKMQTNANPLSATAGIGYGYGYSMVPPGISMGPGYNNMMHHQTLVGPPPPASTMVTAPLPPPPSAKKSTRKRFDDESIEKFVDSLDDKIEEFKDDLIAEIEKHFKD